MLSVVLASASKRRQELLKLIVPKFSILVSQVDESAIPLCDPDEYTKKLAQQKALDVALRVLDESIVIGCDTIVELNGRIMQKPKSDDQAFLMLKMLSGRTHHVFTGVCLINTLSGKRMGFCERTSVTFGQIPDEEIKRYLETGEHLDKAGAYGIQGYGAKFVEKINGDYFNVVGLPVFKLNLALKNI